MAADHHNEFNARDELRYSSDYHAPVLWQSVLEGLVTASDGTYVDGTLGGGGHTEALLDTLGPNGRVIGIDRDAEALREVEQRLPDEIASGRLELVRGEFGDLDRLLSARDLTDIDGLLLDIGVSSHQFDAAERGFSHRFQGPLDMRMDPSRGESAQDLLDRLSEDDIAQLLFDYGEEPNSRRIARRIASERPIRTTDELAELVRASVPTRHEAKSLARVFQALRIAVNDELRELERALEAATKLVREDGRLVVISYHSLEDRRVKRFMRSGDFTGRVKKDLYGNPLTPWEELTRKPVQADDAEIERNPRARSARLRIARRTDFQPTKTDEYGHPIA